MKKLTIKAPAKVNLTLEVLNKREDGFHNIQSIMHTISLFDILTFEIVQSEGNKIILSGNNKEIPYNEKNLVYKACDEFLKYTNIKNVIINCFIEKNIPIAAGLAGGSTDAAATLKALNQLFDNILSSDELHKICAKLGSDLNFTLHGGCCLCTSRGEIIKPLNKVTSKISLVKPKKLGISAKEAYQKCTQRGYKANLNNTLKMEEDIKNNQFNKTLITNDLQTALIEDYQELSYIKKHVPNSLMSGSGSTFFVLENTLSHKFNEQDYEIFENLELI